MYKQIKKMEPVETVGQLKQVLNGTSDLPDDMPIECMCERQVVLSVWQREDGEQYLGIDWD